MNRRFAFSTGWFFPISFCWLMGMLVFVPAQTPSLTEQVADLWQTTSCFAEADSMEQAREHFLLAKKILKEKQQMEQYGRFVLDWIELSKIKLPGQLEPEVTEVIEFLKIHAPEDPAILVQLLTERGQYWMEVDKLEKAEKDFLQAREIIHGSKIQNPEAISQLYLHHGRLKGRFGSPRGYVNDLKQSLGIKKKYLPANDKDIGYVLKRLAFGYKNLGRYDSATLCLKRALDIYREQEPPDVKQAGICLQELGLVFNTIAEFDSAEFYFRQGFEWLSTRKSIPPYGPLNGLGMVNARLGKFEQAIDYFQQRLQLVLVHEDTNSWECGVNYNNLGVTYKEWGREEDAKVYYFKALGVYESAKEIIRPINVGETYFNLSLLLNSDDSLREEYLLKALDYFSEFPYPTYQTLGALAEVYAVRQAYNKAWSCFQKQKDIQSTFGQLPLNNRIQYLSDLGGYYRRQNQLGSAKRMYWKALDLLNASSDQWGLIPVDPSWYLAQLYLDQEQFDSAKMVIEQGYSHASFPNASDTLFSRLPTAYPNKLFRIYQLWAEILLASSEKNPQFSTLDSILQLTDTALTIYRSWLPTVTQTETLLGSADFPRRMCEMASEASIKLYQQSQDTTLLERALNYSNQGQGTLLQLSLEIARQRGSLGLPDSLYEHERELLAGISRYEQELMVEQSYTPLDSNRWKNLTEGAFRLRSEYARLQEQLEEDFPYYRRIEPPSFIRVEDVQAHLSGQEHALLHHLMLDSVCYQWMIHTDTLAFREIPWTPDLNQALAYFRFRGHMDSASSQTFADASFHLYQALIAEMPLPSTCQQLTIIPDGGLAFLPFETLVSSLNWEDIRQAPFLLKQYRIGYATSPGIWLKNRSRDESASKSYGGWAPVFASLDKKLMSDSRKDSIPWKDLMPLFETAIELKEAQQTFGGDIFLTNQASEASFKASAKEYQILHVASHAMVHPTFPLQSRILMSEIMDTTSHEDGLLHAYELLGLNLQAELAMITSCHTGYGPIIEGEGPLSLAWAFAYAGCEASVVSMWQASDLVTAELVQQFCFNLREGMPKDEALRQAKLYYLSQCKDAYQADPMFWAPLVVIGDPTPLYNIPGQLTDLWAWLAVLFVALGVLFWILAARRSRS